jgi:activating molecule in BECN1-regulated autophagy protein 1
LQVNNLDFGDSTLTHATSSGYSNCRPAVIVANGRLMRCRHLESMLSSPCLLWPAHPRDDEIVCPLCNDQAIYSANVQPTLSLAQNSPSDAENQEVSQMGTHMDVSLEESSVANDHDLVSAPLYAGAELNTVRVQSNVRVHIDNAATDDRSNNIPNQVIVLQSRPDGLSGMPMEPPTASRGLPYLHNLEHVGASSSVAAYAGGFDGTSQHYTSLRHLTASVPGIERLFLGPQTYERGVHGVSLSVGSDVPTSLFDGSSAELPCTVELKIWPYNIKNPYDTLYPEACHLTISHVVLCRYANVQTPPQPLLPCTRYFMFC